ncbi:hypothetical protein RFI_38767 [Reticulomyxa filosa]|uniref:Uncharacterized protein n=1 Tax=Reticulomyxa filosa TaxID=46433 RepID=X6LBG7_RETFI|nr:hypothetical protein RFI_38767 [Reticulomyxa filosa]|eukprot:ETN98725.1 hypothetical protein RFI_38767 [Reticulomyxa filosa]
MSLSKLDESEWVEMDMNDLIKKNIKANEMNCELRFSHGRIRGFFTIRCGFKNDKTQMDNSPFAAFRDKLCKHKQHTDSNAFESHSTKGRNPTFPGLDKIQMLLLDVILFDTLTLHRRDKASSLQLTELEKLQEDKNVVSNVKAEAQAIKTNEMKEEKTDAQVEALTEQNAVGASVK